MSLDLLEESVKQCEELKLLSEMRVRKKENREEKDMKVYDNHDWSDLIQSVTLKELGNYKKTG